MPRADFKTCCGYLFVIVLALAVRPTGDLRALGQSEGGPQAGHQALVKTYCVTCHNERLKTGGLVLEGIDLTDVNSHAEVWEKVIRKLRTNAMPPAGVRRPDSKDAAALAGYLESEIDRAATANPNPGRTEAFHRINRAEYENVVRDLLGLDVVDVSELPADDASYGFDNMGSALKVSSSLLEQYLTTARKTVRVAIGSKAISTTAHTFRVKADFTQRERVDGLPLGTRGGLEVPYVFPVGAEYEFRVSLRNQNRSDSMEVSLDGDVLELMDLAKAPSDADGVYVKVRSPVKSGAHRVVATFVADSYALADGFRQPFDVGDGGRPSITSLTITGPFGTTGVSDTSSRRRIFVCYPKTTSEELPCAKQILTAISRRGYRRPVAQQDVEPLLAAYADGRATGDFESGIELALRRLLVSPHFLFRVEQDPSSPNRIYKVTDLELASRLSFFIWSSIPDDELLDLAARAKLRDPGVLTKQVRRMLADPRARELTRNFAGQWLFLRNLPAALPDVVLFPNFNENLRQDFRKETELFFDSLLREDRSVLDLVSADYTFLNERLAKWYGVPGVYGSRFRRVALADENRRGILGQGSFLTVTSHANRTSVVGRGKWILENLLGSPPPPPPPNVPALKENSGTERPRTLRERMAAHRASPVCSSCHARMDPLGFALENFDAVGQWRSQEGFQPIDVTSVLPDGTKVDGPSGLRQMILNRPEQLTMTVAEKMLTYALGRGLEYTDGPTIRSIVRKTAQDNYRLSTLVVAVTESVPFQMRRALSPPHSQVARSEERR
jgi:mono/diheme cytochrome c family protein